MAHIFVIAGHGAGDPGACGNGYQEAERVRALAARIAAYGGSNVTVGDTGRNWYADNGISSLSIPKDWQIIELHMDSAAASARGGHVIIKSGFSADAYDNALANLVGSILPGRSQLIVGRSDLANPKRAAAKGYGYRLVEFGFISNATDVQIFNSRMDDLAKGIVEAFQNTPSSTPSNPAPSVPSGNGAIAVDGWWGKNTTKALQRYFGTPVDGIVSNQDPAQKKYLLRADSGSWDFAGQGNGSDLIGAIQRFVGESDDGFMGPKTIRAWQRKLGVTVDGYMGVNTVTALQNWINRQ